ncbi:MAG: hypothetical protein J1D77_02690 [Muribaculaceae bacterium]|nr:hypothetical protein [Muribaculaceae bacterium]
MDKKIIFAAGLTAVCLLSCDDSAREKDFTPTGDSDDVALEFFFETRAGEDDETGGDVTGSSTQSDFEKYFEDGKSKVLISQRTTNMSLDFTPGSTNCYTYTYHAKPNATWDKDYNFTPDTDAFNWGRIIENGQYSNGYAFGALFFPRDYNYIEEVKDDQSTEKALYESDIFGAWHRTSSLRERLRFRLKHIMSKLLVNLYVPVLDHETNTGLSVDEIHATALNLRTDYTLEWGDRSSEDAPIAKLATTNPKPAKDIPMYMSYPLSPEEINKDWTLDDLGNFNITDISSDKVKKFTFEVLVPEQSPTGDFLKFEIKSGTEEFSFLFNSNSLTTNSQGFGFESGCLNKLELYMTRRDNNIVLMKARIGDWTDASTDFKVTPVEDKK